jgi:hypothetical protein
MRGAAGFVMRRCLFRGSMEDSCPATANGHAGFLVNRVNPSRSLLMTLPPHGKQISPDKNVNFPCTTAAFTLPPEPAGFVVLCQLAQELSLVCSFCPSAQFRGRLGSKRCAEVHPGPSAGLPSDLSSRRRPPILGIFDLPSARTFGSIH